MKTIRWSLSLLFIVLLSLNLSAQKPLIAIQKGHVKNTNSITVSTDNKYFATCSDGAVILWDMISLREIKTFYPSAGIIEDLKFLPDNQHIAIAIDKNIGIININSGEITKEFKGLHDDEIVDIDISPNGKYLLSAGGKTVELWDIASAKHIKVFDYESSPKGFERVAFSDNNKYFIFGWNYLEAKCLVWSFDNLYKPLYTFKENSNNIGFRFSDGQYFGSDGFKGQWNEETKKYSMFSGNWKDINHSSNELQITSSSADGSIIVFTNYGREFFQVRGKITPRRFVCEEQIRRLQLSADGKLAFAISRSFQGGDVYVYNTETGELIKKLPENTLYISHIDIANNGEFLLASAAYDSVMIEKKLNSNSSPITHRLPHFFIENLEVMPDDKQVAFSGYSKKLSFIYNLTSKTISQSLGVIHYATPFCFSPDNKYMAFSKDDGYAYIFDIEQNKTTKTIGDGTIPLGMDQDMTFTHDGKKLIFASWNKENKKIRSVYAWDIEKNELFKKYIEGEMSYELFEVTRNGKYIVAAGGIGYFIADIKVWEANTGKLVHTLDDYNFVINKLCVTHDDKYIISGSHDKMIKFWDIETGELVYNYNNKLSVTDLDLTPDGKYLVIYSPGQGITFLDIEKKEPVYNLMLFNTPCNDWIINTPDGYYMASRNATELMYYYQNNTFYSFDQFDIYYNRPDIVLERIGNASKEVINTYYAAAKKRLLKMDFTKNQANEILSGKFSKELVAPKVVFGDEIQSVSRTKSDKIRFSFKAFDPKKVPLEKIYVNINGVPVYGKDGLKVESANKEEINHKVENLALSNGRNVIEVYVMNKNGITSLRERFDVINENPAVKPDLYLIAIGVSKYDQKEYNLSYAAKDSKDITKTFGKNASGLYNEVVEINLTDKKATKENILAVKETLKNTKVNDQVILFFAGHGLVSENLDYYLATFDIDFESPEANGLLYDDFENIIDNIPARNRLIMMDACHSGEIEEEAEFIDKPVAMNEVKTNNFRGMKRKSIRIKTGDITQLLRSTFHDLRQGTGAIVITSSSGNEYSYEGKGWKNGVFTYAILEKTDMLKKQDKKQELFATELLQYVASRVKELTGGNQNPTMRQENIRDDFRVW